MADKNQCIAGSTVQVGIYVVTPKVQRDGTGVIDRTSQTSQRKPFFTALKDDLFLKMDAKTKIPVDDCKVPTTTRFLAVNKYIESWDALCTNALPTIDGSSCSTVKDSIEAYIENRFDNIDSPISTPRSWKAQLAAMAKAAGGSLDEQRLDQAIRKLLTPMTEKAIAGLQRYAASNMPITRHQQAMFYRLGGLNDVWNPEKQDAKLAELTKTLDGLVKDRAVSRID